MERLHRLTIQEFPSSLGTTKRFAEEGSFSFYDEPCTIRLKGNLEALIREFPFGNLAAEIIAAVSCKEKAPAPCDPLYVKTDELLVSEESLMLWKPFRALLGDVKLIYLPSQLSELLRYNPDFDSSDEHVDYGAGGIAKIEASLTAESEPFFEATLFSLSDGTQDHEIRFAHSLITQRRRSQPARGLFQGPPSLTKREVHTNGALA